jgi:uroporphyrinogen-III decarboxylase
VSHLEIEINCSPERLGQNTVKRRRRNACAKFETVDRTPVVFSISSRYLFRARGVDMGDYYQNPRSQLEQQLLNQKWLIENAVDDRLIDQSTITVAPDLSTVRGGYFPIAMRWFNDGTASTVPLLRAPQDIDALEVPELNAGAYGTMIEWYHQMREMADGYTVVLNGEPLQIDVSVGSGGGPIPDAYALAGQNLFLWMAQEPDRVHRLLNVVTTAFINLQKYVRDLRGDTYRNLGLGADAAEMLSPDMFKEFVVPYYLRCYDAFPGRRGLHNCGRIDHLIPLIAQQLHITHLNGFGFPTDPRLLAEWMGGKTVMAGGLNPILLLQGPAEAIRREVFRYLEILSPYSGYILQDGNNVAPGTPTEHLAAVVEAAEEFAGR